VGADGRNIEGCECVLGAKDTKAGRYVSVKICRAKERVGVGGNETKTLTVEHR